MKKKLISLCVQSVCASALLAGGVNLAQAQPPRHTSDTDDATARILTDCTRPEAEAANTAGNAPKGRITYTAYKDGGSYVMVMDANGKNVRQLTDSSSNNSHSRWSPNGTCLAFVSDRDGNSEIYIMNADGKNQIRLTKTEEYNEESPTWSPDGSMIAYNTDQFGGYSSEILRQNVTDRDSPDDGEDTWGYNPTRLTFSVPTNAARANNFISWSPDGLQIAMESDRDRDDPEIYLLNAVDGSNLQRLNFTRALDEVPSWSPDSQQILYSTDTDGKPKNGNYEIYIMNRDGSNKTRLTNSPGSDTIPSMSFDGNYIVFESWRGGTPELYRMKADGSDVVQLTSSKPAKKQRDERSYPDGNGNPSWSPR